MTVPRSSRTRKTTEHRREDDRRLRHLLADNYFGICDRGFEPVTWSNVPAKLAMAMTELREAEGAAHGSTTSVNDREKWTREVLDCVLRVSGVLTALKGEEWCVRSALRGGTRVDLQPIEVTLWRMLAPMCDAVQAWRAGQEVGSERVIYCLEMVVAEGLDIYREATCSSAYNALVQIVEANRQRPWLHNHVESL